MAIPFSLGMQGYIQPGGGFGFPEQVAPRRFCLMDLDKASALIGWRAVNEGLRYECSNSQRTVTVAADLWVGNKPVEKCRNMEQDLNPKFDLSHMPVTCVALKTDFVALPLAVLIDVTNEACTCDIKWLFSYGCSCGGFKREQERLKK